MYRIQISRLSVVDFSTLQSPCKLIDSKVKERKKNSNSSSVYGFLSIHSRIALNETRTSDLIKDVIFFLH